MRHPSRRSSEVLASLALLGATLLEAPSAHAYCRTAVCAGGVAGQLCEPAQQDDCGTALFWPKSCVGYSLQEDASARVSLEQATEIVETAFDQWEDADCAGEKPSIEADDLGPVACDAREYNQTGGNVNLIVFRDDEWPYTNTANTLALTTVTFNLQNGEIYDADMEVNGTIELTTSEEQVKYDLLSILTHEAGHFLGLAHSSDPEATMYVEYLPGELELRDLLADDVAAICDAYPPDSPHGACDPTPRHGFKATCGPGEPEEDDGCAVRAPGAAASHWWLLALALPLMWRRRRC